MGQAKAFAQRYQRHISKSRKRLVPLVEKIRSANRSLLVRGRFGEPGFQNLMLRENKQKNSLDDYASYYMCIVDRHVGKELRNPPSREEAVRLDASLRKSVSFGLFHAFPLVDGKMENLSSLEGLGLTLGAIVYGRMGAQFSGHREIYEHAIVGNEFVPTFFDSSIKSNQIRHVKSIYSEMPVLLASEGNWSLHRNYEAAAALEKEFGDAEARELFSTSGYWPPATCFEDIKSLCHLWFHAGDRDVVGLYLFIIEVEMLMVGKMLDKMEKALS